MEFLHDVILSLLFLTISFLAFTLFLSLKAYKLLKEKITEHLSSNETKFMDLCASCKHNSVKIDSLIEYLGIKVCERRGKFYFDGREIRKRKPSG